MQAERASKEEGIKGRDDQWKRGSRKEGSGTEGCKGRAVKARRDPLQGNREVKGRRD